MPHFDSASCVVPIRPDRPSTHQMHSGSISLHGQWIDKLIYLSIVFVALIPTHFFYLAHPTPLLSLSLWATYEIAFGMQSTESVAPSKLNPLSSCTM